MGNKKNAVGADDKDVTVYKAVKSFYDEHGVKPKLGSHYGDYAGAALWRIGHLFKAIGVGPGKSFLDVGGGDGRIAVYAGLLGAKSRSVEHDPDLYEKSVELTDQFLALLGEGNSEHAFDRTAYQKSVRWVSRTGDALIELIHASYLDDDVIFNGEDIIFHYEQSTGVTPSSRLFEKLRQQMKPKAILVEHGIGADAPELPPPFRRVALEGPALETMRAHRMGKHV